MKNQLLALLSLTTLFAITTNEIANSFEANPLSEREQEVYEVLEEAIESANVRGYKNKFPVLTNRMPAGAIAPYSVYLDDSNKEHAFFAVCEDKCDGVDLDIKDGRGNSIKVSSIREDAEGQWKVIYYTIPNPGLYQMEVKMKDCEEDFCYFGMGVFIDK